MCGYAFCSSGIFVVPDAKLDSRFNRLPLVADAGFRFYAGVPLIWVIDPHDRTVLIYRPGRRPQFVDDSQELIGEPQLPGFRVPVAQLFG